MQGSAESVVCSLLRIRKIVVQRVALVEIVVDNIETASMVGYWLM